MRPRSRDRSPLRARVAGRIRASPPAGCTTAGSSCCLNRRPTRVARRRAWRSTRRTSRTCAWLAEVASDGFEDPPAIDPVVVEVTGLRRAQVLAVEEVKALRQTPGVR
jgi:hypothetical protein